MWEAPFVQTYYDELTWVIRRGQQQQPIYGLRDTWVFNRAMTWQEVQIGGSRLILAYSLRSPVSLTGETGVSRWFSHPENALLPLDATLSRFVKKRADIWDQVCLPPFQFAIEQHPVAHLQVEHATHPWQFVVILRGRSGVPFYVSEWQEGAAALQVNLLEPYRARGYPFHYAEMLFVMTLWTGEGEEGTIDFQLQLQGADCIIPCLPVIRTQKRAQQEGIPIAALVLDTRATPLETTQAEVTVLWDGNMAPLRPDERGIWTAILPEMPLGDHSVTLQARLRNGKEVTTDLSVRVTDGKFLQYDPVLRLPTLEGKALGPLTGSYRGELPFRWVNTPQERLLHGEKDWYEAIADPEHPQHGYHFWESLTPREVEQDFAYLSGCGWNIVHLCSGWRWWARFDAGGFLSPLYAERLALVARTARQYGMWLHLALSHYPLGWGDPPYAQYLEGGYQRDDYHHPGSSFYQMFGNYVRQFALVFRDETGISSFTASGEGDFACGKTFVNFVHDLLRQYDPNHLVLCEPHHEVIKHPNYYVHEGWKPLLGGVRSYFVDHRPPEAIGVEYRIAAMGHLFMAEGCFYGYLGGNLHMGPEMPIRAYRRRVRETMYTGFALRTPLLWTWEERVVEDERRVMAEIRQLVDWSKPFRTPPLAIRVSAELMPADRREPLYRMEDLLSQVPISSIYLWEDEPAPSGVQAVWDARQPAEETQMRILVEEWANLLADELPLQLEPGWACTYSWSEDGTTLLAFLRAKDSNHPARARLRLRHLPSVSLLCRLYDLERGQMVEEVRIQRKAEVELGESPHFFLLIYP